MANTMTHKKTMSLYVRIISSILLLAVMLVGKNNGIFYNIPPQNNIYRALYY